MFFRHLILLACASAVMAGGACAEENFWPIHVQRVEAGSAAEFNEYLGPLFFQHTTASGSEAGFRPIYMVARTPGAEEGNFLYPFFGWRQQPGFRSFTFFELVNYRADTGADTARDEHFDVWPFYFSRKAEDPADSYTALFPVHGTIKNRFGRDRISFSAFPLYARTVKNGKGTVNAPWPFLRFISGAGHQGFEFWPLFGHSARAGDYDNQFFLWPLFFKDRKHLSEPEPTVNTGALPFYFESRGPGYVAKSYGWPFFGYTHRTKPYQFHETRLFWPLWAQGRGDQRYVNRWAPFYSHSVIKGSDKTWYLWPMFRQLKWEDAGVAQERQQFLFFVYWSLTQRSTTNPAAPHAHKIHLWPLFSSWDNGAGRRQVQALSPFEVFFPNNAKVRQLWSPLFALYRYDRQADATIRHGLLWNAVTYRRRNEESELHMGPLLAVENSARGRRIAFGHGLFGFQRAPGQGWRAFLFDFGVKANNKAATASTP